MTTVERKKYRKTALISLAVLVALFLLARMKSKPVPVPDINGYPQPPAQQPIWNMVENVAFVLMGLVFALALWLAAPLIPFATPVLLIIAALVVVYTLYKGIVSRGSSVWVDGSEATLTALKTNTSVFTQKKDTAPAWMAPVISNDRYINYN